MSDEAVPAGSSRGGGRIVVGVDGSPGSLAALRWALSEASWRGVDVHAVGVWRYAGGRGFNVSAGDPRPRDEMARAMAATIAAATASPPGAEAPTRVMVTTTLVLGDPGWELPAAVGHDDLLVVGSRGHGTAVGLLLGSVSQQVVVHALCPVVVVPNLAQTERGAPT